MTIAECLQKITHELKVNHVADPQMEARFLVQEALLLSSADLVMRSQQELSSEDVVRLESWAKRRAQGEPLAYLSGRRGFYKAEFFVEPGVLIPRPETEFVVTTALRRAPSARSIADFGCGSGCIGLSLLIEKPSAQLWALDLSPVATRVTARNAQRLRVESRVRVIQGRVEEWLPDQTMDLVVANPPYIAEGDPQVEAHVHQFEPHLALYAKNHGLEAIQNWTEAAYRHLAFGGVMVLEIGASQSEAVQAIMRARGFQAIEVTRDLAGIDRVLSAIK